MALTLVVHEPLKSLVGGSKVKVALPPEPTLGSLIQELCRRYGKGIGEELLDGGGNLNYEYQIYINKRLAGFSASVGDGDETHCDQVTCTER